MPCQTGVVTGVWRARPSPPNEDEVEMIEHKIKVERRQLEFLLTAPEFVSKDGVHVLQQIAQVSQNEGWPKCLHGGNVRCSLETGPPFCTYIRASTPQVVLASSQTTNQNDRLPSFAAPRSAQHRCRSQTKDWC